MSGNGALAHHEVLENLPAAAHTCDGDGLITYYNPPAAALWGREPVLNSPEDRYCGSLRLFSADGAPLPHDRCWAALALREDREFLGREVIVERSDSSRVWALAHARPLHDGSGRVTGAVHVTIDITERKRAERAQAAQEAQLRDADRRKDEFLATLAHELRNPLAPLMQGLEILKRKKRDPQAIDSVYAVMARQLKQMARLTDDLLDVGRIGAGKIDLRPEPVTVAEVVQLAVETARSAIQARGHELHVGLPGKNLPLHADPARLAQVLINLLNNSARYTARGGRISLVAEREGGCAVIRVRDTGIGIRPALLADIFQLFAQGRGDTDHGGGLGIGLHIARRLVDLHGGSLTAHSAGEGRGSEFVVRLPLGSAIPDQGKARPMATVLAAGRIERTKGLTTVRR